MFLFNLFFLERPFFNSGFFYADIGILGHLMIGFSLLVFPFFLIFFAEEICWTLVWFRHCFHLRSICLHKGIAILEKKGSLESEQSEASFNFDTYQKGGIFEANPGNFLSLAYGVEDSLRRVAFEVMGKKNDVNYGDGNLDEILFEAGVLTNVGKKKIKMIRWIGESIANGKAGMIPKSKLSIATRMTWEFYQEINLWLRINAEKKGE